MMIVVVMSVSREPLPKIKQLSSDACKTLDTWKQSYLEVRKRIEQSGRDARWEFDRKKLFDRSDYIAQICNDIHSVAQVCVYQANHSFFALLGHSNPAPLCLPLDH